VQAYHHPALRVLLCQAQRRLWIISNECLSVTAGLQAGELRILPATQPGLITEHHAHSVILDADFSQQRPGRFP
jgi:hypothetical protein